MKARQRRKKQGKSLLSVAGSGTGANTLARLEAKADRILERCERMERHAVQAGAVAGGIAGGLAGGAMAVIVLYAKSLFGVR